MSDDLREPEEVSSAPVLEPPATPVPKWQYAAGATPFRKHEVVKDPASIDNDGE